MPNQRRVTLFDGLATSVGGNAQAFGFSITITVTFGAVQITNGDPTIPELFGFALAGVVVFSILNLVVAARGERDDDGADGSSTPGRAVLLATATDLLAVTAAVGSALAVRLFVAGWPTWLLAPFVAGLVYVLVQSVELTVGRQSADEE